MAGTSRPKRLQGAVDAIRNELSELEGLKEEYEEWKENLPENLQSGALAEKLEETVDGLQTACDDIENALSEVETIELPRGFGRD